MITRREAINGAVVAAALCAATSLSACSPREYDGMEPSQNLFGKIASRKYEDAAALLTPKAGMSVISLQNSQLFVGAKDIVGELSNIIHVGGFKMIGDNPAYAPGGLTWRNVGPWSCCDMAKNGKLTLGNCDSQLADPIFNVFVLSEGIGDAAKVSRILLLENKESVFNVYPEGF